MLLFVFLKAVRITIIGGGGRQATCSARGDVEGRAVSRNASPRASCRVSCRFARIELDGPINELVRRAPCRRRRRRRRLVLSPRVQMGRSVAADGRQLSISCPDELVAQRRH